MTNLIPSGLDDLLCLPKRLHIVIAARKRISLADLCRDAGDVKGAYRHQAYELARAKYVTIDHSSSHPPSLSIETTALGRKQLTQHIAAIHALTRALGVTEPVSTAIPRRRNTDRHSAPAPAPQPDHRQSGDHANSATAELVRALDAVRQHLPHTVDDILHGQMTPDRQHEFADLLFELGRLLHRDAIHEAVRPRPANAITAGTHLPWNSADVVAFEEEQP
jgi:hypothetical protein